jgi:cyclic pyranopterin phosphate synthase
VFVSLGVERIRLTGGEPLVREDLVDIVHGLKALPGVRELCLTTNAHRLAELARPLATAGIDAVNISLDTLDADEFRALTKTGDVTRVVEGLVAAGSAGFKRLAVNAVVMGGRNDDPAGLAALARFAWAHGAIPRFIELMPFAGAGAVVSVAELVRRLQQAGLALEPRGRRDGAGPAKYWTATDVDGEHEIGFIGAMTDNFCASCNRVRLSAKGSLRACLGGRDEAPLSALLRAGADDRTLAAAIRGALAAKWDGHRFVEDGAAGLLPMMGIGG